MEKQKLTFEQKLDLKNINTFDGKKSFNELIEKPGVRHRTLYFAIIERKVKDNRVFAEKKEILSRGVVFKDGFALKNIESSIWNWIGGKIIEIQERHPNYKP